MSPVSRLQQDNALTEIAYADNTHIYFGYDSRGAADRAIRDMAPEAETFAYLTPGGYITTDGDGNKTTIYFNMFGAPAVTIDPSAMSRDTYDDNLI